MEIKNTTPYTYDCILEFNSSFRRGYRRLKQILSILLCGAFVLLLTLQGLLLLLGDTPTMSPSSVAFSFCMIVLLLTSVIAPPLMIKRTARKQAANENVADYVFTEDGFEQSTISKTIKSQEQCPYSILTSVTESEHYFYLFINPRAAHIVAKNGFTEGNENDFRMLLRTVVDPQKLHIR